VSSIEQQTAKRTKSRYAQSNAIEMGWLVGTGRSACATEQRKERLRGAAKFQRCELVVTWEQCKNLRYSKGEEHGGI
jgi:hypothetical protein